MALKPSTPAIDFSLRPESEESRVAQAAIGIADIAECRARMAALTTPGRIYDEDGAEIVVPAAVAREMFEARRQS